MQCLMCGSRKLLLRKCVCVCETGKGREKRNQSKKKRERDGDRKRKATLRTSTDSLLTHTVYMLSVLSNKEWGAYRSAINCGTTAAATSCATVTDSAGRHPSAKRTLQTEMALVLLPRRIYIMLSFRLFSFFFLLLFICFCRRGRAPSFAFGIENIIRFFLPGKRQSQNRTEQHSWAEEKCIDEAAIR